MDTDTSSSSLPAPRALILHGFSGNLETVRALGPLCEARGLPYRMPLLRGHGTRPEDLVGVTWRDWYADAEQALLSLTSDGTRAVILGLSMGGLLALDLAARHADRVCGVVTIAAALELSNPLLPLLPLLARVKPWWNGKRRPGRTVPVAYPRFPLRGVASLVEYATEVRTRLREVKAPLLVLASRADDMVTARAASDIAHGVGSTQVTTVWFERSEHDMLIGEESTSVVDWIDHWLDRYLTGWRLGEARPGSGE